MNTSGRVMTQQDATGIQYYKFKYMGNVVLNRHTYVQPGSPNTINNLETNWSSYSWGRVLSIIYPDVEKVRFCKKFNN